MERPSFNVFTVGDANKLSTWSNVPYYFTRSLEQAGCKVNRVDIGQNRFFRVGYDAFWMALRKLGISGSRHDYFRSPIHHYFTGRIIERALRTSPADQNLFITFSFGSNRQGKDFILFCDMTYERHIRHFEGREPNAMERHVVKRERQNLRNASMVVSLFPELAEDLGAIHGEKVRYLGNVLNMDTAEMNAPGALELSRKSNEIVFIGDTKYKPGLLRLLEAKAILNNRMSWAPHLHVIGIKRSQILERVPANVTFHGYLDKDDAKQRAQYYDILRRARIFANPNPKWGAFSASVEAMHLYTPVVVFPYMEFAHTFGAEENVGLYLNTQRPAEIADRLERLLVDDELWEAKVMAAHKAVEQFTWDNYVHRFLQELPTVRTSVPKEPIEAVGVKP